MIEQNLWPVLALIGAFFDATYYVLVKKFIKGMHRYEVLAGGFIVSSTILFIIAFINGIPEIQAGFTFALIATVILCVIAAMLYTRALAASDISLMLPILAFTPAFMIVTSYIQLDEVPTLLGIGGILLITFGAYLLKLRKTDGLLDPLVSLFKESKAGLMLIVAFIFSLSSNFDKMIVLASDSIFSIAIKNFSIGLIILSIRSAKDKNCLKNILVNWKPILLVGFVFALAMLTINAAFVEGYASYVIGIKRTSILFGIIYGAWLFKEKQITQRIIAALIMLLGVILLII